FSPFLFSLPYYYARPLYLHPFPTRRSSDLFDNPLPHLIGDTVPHLAGPGAMIFQGLRPAGAIKIIPVVKSGPGNAELLQRAFNRQMRVLDQPDDLKLLGRGVSHSPSPPSASMLFLSSRSSSACPATTSFSS